MGITINKVMGYGIKSKYDEDKEELYEDQYCQFLGKIKDNDCNLNEISNHIARLKHIDVSGTFNIVKSDLNIYYNKSTYRSEDLYKQFIVTCDEYDPGEQYIVFTMGNNNWSRTDDDIDYEEYFAQNIDNNNIYKTNSVPINRGIFPYIDYELIYGQEPVDKKYKYSVGDYNNLINIYDENISDMLLHNYRPVIPSEIFALLMHVSILDDWESQVQNLRPMIVTYWS